MEKCNIFLPTIHSQKGSPITDEKWDEAMSYYQSGQYEKIIPTLVDYLSADFGKYKTPDGYSIPHGSVVVDVKLSPTHFHVECPFVDISEAKKVPLMRKLAELRLNPLDLTNISLRNDKAMFEYSCPLELCEPYKIYDVLKEICVFADMYDDEFIEKFDAKSMQEPRIEPISDSLKETAFREIKHLIEDNIARLDYYISKRDGGNAWITLNVCLKQIEFYARPQGFLRTQIERAINAIYRRDLSLHDILLQGKEDLLKFLNYDKDKFFDSLYLIETFVPSKYSGKIDNIRENWEEPYEEVQEMINDNEHEDACMKMLSNFYNLFYYNLVNEDIARPITEAMAKASGQSWREAAASLFQGMQAIMEDNVEMESHGMDLSQMMQEQMQNSMSMLKNFMSGFNK